jgi:hypothetical protein
MTDHTDLSFPMNAFDARPPEDAAFAVACWRCDSAATTAIRVEIDSGGSKRSGPKAVCDEHLEAYRRRRDATVEVLDAKTRTIRGVNEFSDLHDFESDAEHGVHADAHDADGEPVDRVVLAFHPTDADYATDGHRWSLYNPAAEHPYCDPPENAAAKVQRAIERDDFDPHEYPLRDGERWTRLDYESVLDGNPKRVTADGQVIER